jgi:hypothetical protein
MAQNAAKATVKAQACLAKAVPIPSAPLLHMGNVALRKSEGSFTVLQDAIDYLSCKAKARPKIQFTDDEKEFLIEIFEALWWGGHAKRFPEAAQLANHYVHGSGRKLQIDADVYKSSVVVRDSIAAMKDFIRDQAKKGKTFAALHSNASVFIASPQFKTISKVKGRSVNTQGYVDANGVLLAEQNNPRLKNADHRFRLQSQSVRQGQRVETRWKVESYYDFEPFAKASYVTHIPLADGKVLKLPDGLANYMTAIGIAHDFAYWAEWTDEWTL